MKYLLTVLTNNRPVYLERSIRWFTEHVRPHPVEAVIMDDGGGTPDLHGLLAEITPWAWRIERSSPALGQCGAMSVLWQAARDSSLDWTFHLEDDQVIVRPVDLNKLRLVLETHEHIKQMTLMRAPWGAEIEHGGYIPSAPGWYHRHHAGASEWIETTRNWAFAPALMHTKLASEFDFPEIQAETAIGPVIREKYPDATFGLWGWGEPWCAHIGVEKGARAFGY